MERPRRDDKRESNVLLIQSVSGDVFKLHPCSLLECFREIFDMLERSGVGADVNCLIPVSDTPSFAITRLPGFGIPIVEGMSVSLKCEVDSNPASTPIWQRGKWRVEREREREKKRRTYMTLLLIPQTNVDLREN